MDFFGRDAADGDEVAKGELRAATYSELALGTFLTRNEPDRVDYPGLYTRDAELAAAWGHCIIMLS